MPDVQLQRLISSIEKQGSGMIYRVGRESPVIKGFNLFMSWEEIYANVARLTGHPFEARRDAAWMGFSDTRTGQGTLGYEFCHAWFSEKDGSLAGIELHPEFVNFLFESKGLSIAQFIELFSKAYKIPLNLESKVMSDKFDTGQYSETLFYRHTDPNGWAVTVAYDVYEGIFVSLKRTPSTTDTKFGD